MENSKQYKTKSRL